MNEEQTKDLLERWIKRLESMDRTEERRERTKNIDILLNPDSPEPLEALIWLEEMLGEKGIFVEFDDEESERIINQYAEISAENVLAFLKEKGVVRTN